MIIYFTGTGNSRYLAEIIAEQTADIAVDAARLIKKGEYPNFSSEKPYVFVAPTYAWRLPKIFEAWIRKCSFDGSSKAYFILNCGNDIGAAGKYAKKLCSDMNFVYMGMAEIVMPENYIAMFSAPSKEKETKIIAKATGKVKLLSKTISEEKRLETVKITALGQLCSSIVNDCFYKFIISTKKFYSTDACISCGKCVDNCMMNNITLKDGKPLWGKDCVHCMACICKCPVEAIEYGKHTKGLRRYTCPEETGTVHSKFMKEDKHEFLD